jgi:translation initiation factor IF-3
LKKIQGQRSSKGRIRKNEEIMASELRVVDFEGEQVGVMSKNEALSLAQKQSLDLVEISPSAKPPVCKIMDFGSYLYQKKKELKSQKTAQKVHSVKEIKFGIRISDHDFEVRTTKARKFLEKGHPVKVILQFRGREQSHSEIGVARIDEMRENLEDIGKQEFEPKTQGRSIVTEFRPLSKKGK